MAFADQLTVARISAVPLVVAAAIVAGEFLVSGLSLAALERGVVLQARDLGKLKSWLQAVAAGFGVSRLRAPSTRRSQTGLWSQH